MGTSPLEVLAAQLGPDVSRERLVDALYVIRAPRNLVGIIPAMRQFRDWRRTYRPLGECPELPGYPEALAVLDRIASLDETNKYLSGRVTARHENVWTPLRPLTGDSVICELLLVRAGQGVDARDFERASAWLLWQAQRFNRRWNTRAAYAPYLTSDAERLLERRYGHRLYGAYLALRHVAVDEPEARERLALLIGCIGEFSDAQSRKLTLLVRLARLAGGGAGDGLLRRHALEKMGLSPEALKEGIAQVRRVVPPDIARLLIAIWGAVLDREVGVRVGSSRTGGVHGVSRPQVRRGQRLTEVLLAADEGEIQAGTVVEFYPVEELPEDRPRKLDPDEDDPEEPREQPGLSLFLADDEDLLKGYYAAKGIQNAIEYDNAQLHWNKWTLSATAVHAVVDLVTGSRDAASEPLEREARLAIGLSLLTGRALAEVVRPPIEDEVPELARDVAVVISRRPHRVHVRAGQPELRRPPVAPPPFCRPRSTTLSLPLPPAWQPLLEAIQDPRPRSRKAVVAQANRLLRELAPELRVTAKGVRSALLRALNGQTRGDLGALGVVTAGAEANARNIIHYAAYPHAQIEGWWRDAAASLVGALPEASAPAVPDAWIGAQHAFDEVALVAYFAEVKSRMRAAEARRDWPRAFNLMTLYLSYWLGLGLAHRRSLAPVPRIILVGDWALVADKHRADRSTDRLVPLTRGLRGQIEAYVALASELAIAVPALDPLVVSAQGTEVRLQYIFPKTSGRKRDVVPYQPKYQEKDERLTPLPANWGRKVVRSWSGHLPGRFRDAELGHWVRGRHAWDATSTFDSGRFQAAWLELQEALEQRLGFVPMTLAERARAPRPRTLIPAPTAGRAAAEPRAPSKEATPALDVREFLRRADQDRFEAMEQDTATATDRAPAALSLAREIVRAQQGEPVERQRAVAESVCQYLRTKWKVPIFVARPRPLFAHKVLVDGDALQTLAYLEAHVLPAFARDLANLPPRPSAPGAEGKEDGRPVELGRLLMLAIWRLGLTRWGLIDAWLRELKAGAPNLAHGDNRTMVFRVKREGAPETMQRTVFLDDFCAAYLTIERASIQTLLLPPLFKRPSASHRRARAEKCLNAYLARIGAGDPTVTLAAMTAAATQQIMVHGTPILAAYARGSLETEDLGDGELRRLAGLEPSRRSGAGVDEGLPATRAPALGEADLPTDVLHRVPVMQALGWHQTPYRGEWLRLVSEYRPRTPAERLLRSFALWLIHTTTDPAEHRVNPHQKRSVVNRVRVIACALLGLSEQTPDWRAFDQDILVQLQEISREQFPDRLQHGAWFQFHRFLSDETADHAGFAIGSLGAAPERAVSAKILSAEELRHLHARLLSVTSGIGNAALRTSAQRHVELMATFGLRRAESAHLRAVDVQEDLCRVQAYGDHTLKTAWADRVLPIGFAEEGTQTWIRAVAEQRYQKLIDPDPGTSADPNNFYDALSRLIKAVTRDASMGSHHLRHTLVSRLVLTLLWQPAGLDGLCGALPWLEGLKIGEARMQGLLGPEGDAGQGLRAVAALVGHSHPNTTIRHYTHVLCVALHGVLHKLDDLDMCHSFEQRLAGRATIHRWVAEIREADDAPGDATTQRHRLNRALRNRIEQRLDDAGIDRDETPLSPLPEIELRSGEGEARDGIHFEGVELVDRSLRDGHRLVSVEEEAAYRAGLERLSCIRSGKKGSTMPRHVLEGVDSNTWVPPALAARSATTAAVMLCRWLEALRTRKEDDFRWLIGKWMYTSERERGRMLLVDDTEIARARRLGDSASVRIEVSQSTVALRDLGGDTKPVPRMRIKCVDDQGKSITRDTVAVRWVMTYVAARWG
ncbi:MAG: hypothetical protein ACYCPE_03355 [Metallibacterium sp.]